jgi:hypothetical protein
MGKRVSQLAEPPANPGPSPSQDDDPGLVRFLIVGTSIFAAMWFGLSQLAGLL